MVDNITQFATLFKAYGSTLNYRSEIAKLEIRDGDNLTNSVVADITHFDDCANYLDGAAALCLADFLDNERNPLSDEVRENVLHGLGIKKEGKFIYQVLSLQKNNRAWHFSEIPNDCGYFGPICTHRGIVRSSDHYGKRSTRQPEDYHPRNSKGMIIREQLVTPALEKLFKSIPEENMVSGRMLVDIDSLVLKRLTTLNLEDRLKLITQLQEIA